MDRINIRIAAHKVAWLLCWFKVLLAFAGILSEKIMERDV